MICGEVPPSQDWGKPSGSAHVPDICFLLWELMVDILLEESTGFTLHKTGNFYRTICLKSK